MEAGVKDIRIHDFRHSCTSLLIDSGANITLVAKYLRHSKIDKTLNTYSHMYQNRLDSIVNIIEQNNSNYSAYKNDKKDVIKAKFVEEHVEPIYKKRNKAKDSLSR